MRRLYPAFVSLLGSLGLATTLAYLIAIILSFQPGWSDLAEFMVGIDGRLSLGFTLVAIPYVLLLAHLYFRTRLGHWLVEHGYVEDAIEYCTKRLTPGLLRSQKEVQSHRVALARAHAVRGDYRDAWEILREGGRPLDGPFAAEYMRWAFEIALRRENLIDCHDLLDDFERLRGSKKTRASILGCAAEMAVREKDEKAYGEHVESGRWMDPNSPRIDYSEALGLMNFGTESQDWSRALELIERCFDAIAPEIPLRRPEILACRARLQSFLDRPDEARASLEKADELEADQRAAYVLGDLKKSHEWGVLNVKEDEP